MIEKFIKISEGQMCEFGNSQWFIARLITLTKDFEVMEVPLESMNIYYLYDKLTLREMVTHMHAVSDADLSYPIILDEDGELLDGRHRIMKALFLGKKTIKAVKFDVNPDPCRKTND
jgi:hypothetical protein